MYSDSIQPFSAKRKVPAHIMSPKTMRNTANGAMDTGFIIHAYNRPCWDLVNAGMALLSVTVVVLVSNLHSKHGGHIHFEQYYELL